MLEGERQSFEVIKGDLMRRIKMLEFALRQERYEERPASAIAQRVARPNRTAHIRPRPAPPCPPLRPRGAR